MSVNYNGVTDAIGTSAVVDIEWSENNGCVPIFLEWEITFNDVHLKGNLEKFVLYAQFYDMCVRNKVKITVNQMRKLTGNGPHPDDRGLMFVFEEDPARNQAIRISRLQSLKVFLLKKYAELGDETLVPDRKGCTGFLSKEEIDKMFPELADLASKAE